MFHRTQENTSERTYERRGVVDEDNNRRQSFEQGPRACRLIDRTPVREHTGSAQGASLHSQPYVGLCMSPGKDFRG